LQFTTEFLIKKQKSGTFFETINLNNFSPDELNSIVNARSVY